MRKFKFIFAFALGCISFANANNYRLDEEKVESAFASGVEVTFDQMFTSQNLVGSANFSNLGAEGEKTQVGFLLRAFFCGSIALHRYYMGTTRDAMWAMYCCIPVVGGINAFVDFWWAVFVSDAYTKYANNDKYIVWLSE